MIGFLIKKAFFDTWDNLFKLLLFNLMSIPSLLIAYLGLKLIPSILILGILVIFLAAVLLVIHQGTVFYFLKEIGDNQSVSVKDYFKYLKKDLGIKIKFGISLSIFLVIATTSIGYYLSGKGMVTILPLAFVFWFLVLTLMATMMFFPIKIRLEGSFIKVIKKCFIILFDNFFTGIIISIYVLLLAVLSIPSLGLIFPGLSAIGCVVDTMVHLYELKYDYLDKNPDSNRKKIPWVELTYELNENIGPRSLKSMIFPWKD